MGGGEPWLVASGKVRPVIPQDLVKCQRYDAEGLESGELGDDLTRGAFAHLGEVEID